MAAAGRQSVGRHADISTATASKPEAVEELLQDKAAPEKAPATAMSKSKKTKLEKKAVEATKKAAAASNEGQQASSSSSTWYSEVCHKMRMNCNKHEY